MKTTRGAVMALVLLASASVLAAEELSIQARGALANANLASAGRTAWLFWRTTSGGNATAPAAFDTKYNAVLRPEYGSGTHTGGAKLYFVMDSTGAIIGGITPFGAEICSEKAIGRKLALSAYFGRSLKPIALGPLERLQYTPEGGAPETLCYYPFRIDAAAMDRNFTGASNTETMRFTVRVDDKVDHSVWTGAEYTPFQRGSGRSPQALTKAQYEGLRASLPLLPR